MANARAEWFYPTSASPKTPTGFRVYTGPNIGSLTLAATVLYAFGYAGAFRANLSGLTPGSTYVVVVRAYNAVGEEQNTLSVTLVIPAAPPAPVESLVASAV